MTAPSVREPRRPDVALLLPTLGGGGAERVMVDLAGAFVELGREVDVVVASRRHAAVMALPAGVGLVELGSARVATALVPLARYLRRERPRALLSTLEHVNVAALLARRVVPGMRVVVREANTVGQAMADDGGLSRQLLWAMRRTYPRADAAIAVSAGVADALTVSLGVPRERVALINNPVITPRLQEGASQPLDHPWFAAGEPPVVLGVGRLALQKRFDTLLEAFAAARARVACRLVILGEGEQRGELEGLARGLGVAEDVDLKGFVDNPFAYMARAGAFVLSSAYEGLPNALIQAMALGAPAVATDCPSGPREILDGGRLGALVEVGDSAAMADAIVDVLERPRSEPPPEWYRRYGLDTVARRYLEVLGMPA
jgi:glycosyltransferase involved in cell wall biosynthesis